MTCIKKCDSDLAAWLSPEYKNKLLLIALISPAELE